ncbi:hypothetical protein F5146DRAFT_1180912 [Armillaria mellea]|nr:hypothetical protein F5146DRAFT_1180912 [Armillaria mellea]
MPHRPRMPGPTCVETSFVSEKCALCALLLVIEAQPLTIAGESETYINVECRSRELIMDAPDLCDRIMKIKLQRTTLKLGMAQTTVRKKGVVKRTLTEDDMHIRVLYCEFASWAAGMAFGIPKKSEIQDVLGSLMMS